MTREEFYSKYGDVKVKFSNYYKYVFSYTAELPDGYVLTCEYGGNSAEIYRHEECSDGIAILSTLQPFGGSVYKDGIVIDSFYDY